MSSSSAIRTVSKPGCVRSGDFCGLCKAASSLASGSRILKAAPSLVRWRREPSRPRLLLHDAVDHGQA